jgi:filamentous hemagglutinin family protein
MKTALHTAGVRSERRRRPTASFVMKALPSALALAFLPAGWADPLINAGVSAGLPQNGSVVSGTATGSVAGNQLTVNQGSARAVIDWSSFNIDAGKTMQFVQPTGGAVLNRVNAATDASQIAGTLSANGMVMLMNPHGVLFSPGSSVNVGALIATTGTIDENTFSNTAAQITGATTGVITNEGNITATAGANGLVALVAPSVVNQGVIAATGGTIALLGTTATTISLNNNLYEFAIPGGATGNAVTNAAGASLSAKALHLGVGDAANLLSGVINLEGVQQATGTIVVNGDQVHLKSALQAPGVSGNSNTVDVYAGASIQDGVKIAKTGTAGAGATVHVNAGTYTEQVVLNKANLTLTGREGAKIFVPTPGPADNSQIDGVTISAANVTVSGLEIAGDLGNQSHGAYAWDNRITRGIAVRDGATNFTISGNNIHDVRNGILIHGRNGTQNRVTGNRIENTKGAISVQYTDGSGITIAGNTQGVFGNEWGLNLHLNGHMDGSGSIVSNTPPIAAAPTLAWQQALLDLSTTNDGWSVQDQGYTSSNRTHVHVAEGGSAGAQGSARSPINTIQGGINAVVTGGTVRVADGNYVQSSTLNINKSLTLSGTSEASTLIDARGVNGYGMTVTADDVTLNNFSFYGPTANVGSAYGIKVSPRTGDATDRVHNFAISNVTIRGSGRAELDLNGVVGAVIDGVTADGRPVDNDGGTTAGAGIQITDSSNVTVRNSTTRGNQWGGLAIYQANRVYDQQVNNIVVEANNSFGELNPVYLQDESASRNFGALNIAGFDYAVRNSSSTNNNHQYTWLQATEQNAFDLAVNTQSSGDSYVQGWSGTGTTQAFVVGTGNRSGGGTQVMSIGAAVVAADAGASVDVRAGTYAENVIINKALTITGAGVDQSIVTPASGDAFAVRGNIGANATVLIDGFTFKDAPGSGVSVANDTVLGQLTVQNSSFNNNGRFGFTVNGSSTAGVALSNVLLRNNRFSGNGNPATGATALGLGNVHFNYFNGNATLQDLHITGAGEHNGIHFRGYHSAAGAVRDAGQVVFENVTLDGSFRRPAGSVGTWNPEGPGYGIHFFEYASVDNVSFNNVVVDTTVGHGIVVEGLGSTLDIGNTRFGRPDTSIVGGGSNPTASLNIATGTNSQNNVKSSVNATRASFTGATSGFDIEDRVGHALDASGLGLVTWDAGNVYVTQKSGSVQRGVDAAGVGETVNVGAGTFAENVTINKALTLDGAGSTQTIIKAPSSASGTAVTVSNTSNVTITDLQIADSFYGLQMTGTSNNVTVDRVAFNNNSYGVRNGTGTRADNFRMLNSTVTGGLVGVQAYNNSNNTASFANALFENVTIDGPSYKGFYFETADNLTLRNVTVTNAGNVGEPTSHQNGAAIDINLKYGAFNAITFDNVVVKNSGQGSDAANRAAVVIKTRGFPGDTAYSAAPASLQSVNITGGSIEGSTGTGIRFETLSNGNGGQPVVRVSGTQFKNNTIDITVDRTNVDARGAVFVGAANGFAIEDRVTHALDTTGRGLVTWEAGQVYVTQDSGSVQRGVDAGGVGDTVNVAGGTFADNVNVDTQRNLAFNDTRLQSLTVNSGAAGSGIGGAVTAEGAGGFNFKTNVNLLADTALTTRGADITFSGDIQNAGGAARALQLVAGSGATRGNVYMNTGGLASNALGRFDVSANNFKLDSTLWVSAYKIDALGNVALSNSTLRAQDAGAASSLNAGGDVTGSTISQGSVAVVSAGDIVANIAGTDVLAQAQGNMNVVVAASNSASLSANSVVASVTSPTLEVAAVTEATISGAASQMTVNAPRGSVSGNFGQVTNTGGGVVNINGKPQPNPSVSSNAENNRVVPVGGVQEGGVEAGGFQLAQADGLGTEMGFSTPEAAGQALDRGQTVELDMSPRNQRSKNNGRSGQGSDSEKDKE